MSTFIGVEFVCMCPYRGRVCVYMSIVVNVHAYYKHLYLYLGNSKKRARTPKSHSMRPTF